MFSQHYYHGSLRRYIIAFGTMFSDIAVQRTDNSGTLVQTIAVPLSYANKERFLVRLREDPNLTRVAVQLPRMGFEILSMNYDPERKQQGTVRNVAVNSSNPNRVHTQYTGVPWTLQISLSAYVRNADDGAQVVEQIVPFFGPEWTNTVRVVPTMGINYDASTILTGVGIEDTYEGALADGKRLIIYSFDFQMKCMFYGPIRHAGIIKRVQADIGAVQGLANTDLLFGQQFPDITDEQAAATGRSSRIVVTPGLYANGVGTSNSAASINYRTIAANTNWQPATNTFFYTDGRKYNPTTLQDE